MLLLAFVAMLGTALAQNPYTQVVIIPNILLKVTPYIVPKDNNKKEDKRHPLLFLFNYNWYSWSVVLTTFVNPTIHSLFAYTSLTYITVFILNSPLVLYRCECSVQVPMSIIPPFNLVNLFSLPSTDVAGLNCERGWIDCDYDCAIAANNFFVNLDYNAVNPDVCSYYL